MDDDCTNKVQHVSKRHSDEIIVNMYRKILCSFQTPQHAGWSGFAPSTATSTVAAECEVMEEEEELHPEQVGKRLEMRRQETPGAQR